MKIMKEINKERNNVYTHSQHKKITYTVINTRPSCFGLERIKVVGWGRLCGAS